MENTDTGHETIENHSNSMLCNVFETQSLTYNFRTQIEVVRSSASTSRFGLNSMKNFASVWQIILIEVKTSDSIKVIEKKKQKEGANKL